MSFDFKGWISTEPVRALIAEAADRFIEMANEQQMDPQDAVLRSLACFKESVKIQAIEHGQPDPDLIPRAYEILLWALILDLTVDAPA